MFKEHDRVRIQRSVVEWTERTAGPKAQHSRLKQQRSRLMRAVRPREPMPEPVDPLEVAHAGLLELGEVRRALRDRPRALGRLAAAEETIRRLAWGPDNELHR
jgi:hypothetical protein